MLWISIYGIHFTTMTIDNACDIFFNTFSMYFADTWKSIPYGKDKMCIKIVELYFHRLFSDP